MPTDHLAVYQEYEGTEIEHLGEELFAELYSAIAEARTPIDEDTVRKRAGNDTSRLPLSEAVICACVGRALRFLLDSSSGSGRRALTAWRSRGERGQLR